ncbi:hypothetical protein GGR56DRAFT_629831, partial [Xylariaceae sp. FL0804]
MPSFGNFLHTQYVLKIPKPSDSFHGKTIIITGANGGLGKEIAKHIIRLGAAKVIFACRSEPRGRNAKAEVEKAMRCNSDIIEVWQLDLESVSSVKSFVDRANALPRLDVLINNAGIWPAKTRLVYDTDVFIAVNLIGTFLVALQLLPKLKETGHKFQTTTHMTTVTSALYDAAKYPEKHGDDLFVYYKDPKHVDVMNQYNLSKLLQLFALQKLCAIVDSGSAGSYPVVINSIDPCFCKTGLSDEIRGVARVFFKTFEAMTARTPEEGSRLVVQSAAAGRETHGGYMRAGAVQELAPNARDEKKATYVWELLSKKLEQLQPGIMENV